MTLMIAAQRLADLRLAAQHVGQARAAAHVEELRQSAATEIAVHQRYPRIARPRRGQRQVGGGERDALPPDRAGHGDDDAALDGLAPERSQVAQPVQQHPVLLRRRSHRRGQRDQPLVDARFGRAALDALEEPAPALHCLRNARHRPSPLESGWWFLDYASVCIGSSATAAPPIPLSSGTQASTGSASAEPTSLSLRSDRSDSSWLMVMAIPSASAPSSERSRACWRFGLAGVAGGCALSSTRNSLGPLFCSRSAVISASAFLATSCVTLAFSISESRDSSESCEATSGAPAISLSISACRFSSDPIRLRPRAMASLMRRRSRSLAAARAFAACTRPPAASSSRFIASTSGWLGR